VSCEVNSSGGFGSALNEPILQDARSDEGDNRVEEPSTFVDVRPRNDPVLGAPVNIWTSGQRPMWGFGAWSLT
jgi:hypothetical protein